MALTAEQQAMDFNPELQDVNRQQKLAELLMAKGAQNQPQGQMISGHYVAPSWTQQLNPIANILAGQAVGQRADTEQTKMAEALRTQKGEALATFQELMAKPETRGQAMKFAASNRFLQPLAAKLAEGMKLGEGEKFVIPGMDGQSVEVASGDAKYHAPLQIDTGTMIEIRDPKDPTKVIARMPKSQMPTAGQVVETANGPMLVNTRTGQAQPVMAGGQPLPAALDTKQKNEVSSINEQRSVIEGALKAVKETPNAFSLGRGIAGNMPLGETLAGRTQSADQTAARSYVYNVVSKVINERAGAAQSKQELQRLSSFLPSEYDNAKTIEDKLNGFKGYLSDLEKGARAPVSGQMSQAPQAPKKVVNFNDLP